MSGIRPIGSEKLQGMDKIKRIMEIARFNENKAREHCKSFNLHRQQKSNNKRQPYILSTLFSVKTD